MDGRRWVAIDTETASTRDTPCQIAAVRYESGAEVASMATLVYQPEEAFFGWNIAIHGITPEDVEDAPGWPQVLGQILAFVGDDTVIAHNAPFDIGVISQASLASGLALPSMTYACTLAIARRTWPEFGSHSLSALTEELGLVATGRAHEAASDARLAAAVLEHAMRIADVDDLIALIDVHHGHLGRLSESGAVPFRGGHLRGRDFAPDPAADPSGPLYGRTVVFTGAIAVPRREAMELVARAGGRPGDSVTSDTDYLVCGLQDLQKLAEGQSESSKFRKAQALRGGGQEIEIISEQDFWAMVDLKG